MARCDLAGGWLTVSDSKTDAGPRKVKIRPVLRDVPAELRTGVDPAPQGDEPQDAEHEVR